MRDWLKNQRIRACKALQNLIGAYDGRSTRSYLFTGFLDAGKTRFIRETLQDKRFNDKEPTLLLVCEEGEEEYEPNAPYMKNVTVRTLGDMSEFNEENLKRLTAEAKATKVVVEYNGMWMLNDFYQLMPEEWVVYQEMMFADANTIESYNANMRNLVYDKMSSCELVYLQSLQKRCGQGRAAQAGARHQPQDRHCLRIHRRHGGIRRHRRPAAL